MAGKSVIAIGYPDSTEGLKKSIPENDKTRELRFQSQLVDTALAVHSENNLNIFSKEEGVSEGVSIKRKLPVTEVIPSKLIFLENMNATASVDSRSSGKIDKRKYSGDQNLTSENEKNLV